MGGNLKVNKQSYENLHYGRQRIILPYSEVTSENLEEVMKKALNIHSENASDCDYLIHYFLGDQDILDRPNSGTSNINNTTVVNCREILIRALLCGATNIIIIHNHPSGVPEPSREDVQITKKLQEASELIGIQFSDHIIIGRDGYYSFNEEKMKLLQQKP